jgi:hypothetical protein
LRKTTGYLDTLGGALICVLGVLTPWLYGTTEDWAVRLMNIGCFVVGSVFLAVWTLERLSGGEPLFDPGKLSRWTGRIFLAINLCLLAFCAIAYFNARATFSIENQSFTYNEDFNRYLPTSYDKRLTAQVTLTYLAYFAMFWSARYWLLRGWNNAVHRGRHQSIYSNRRLRLLLWVLSLNGIILALQCILQRLSRSPKLLWVRNSWWGSPDACFGPFSYRGNAAEYFNLIWPLAFGLFFLALKNRRVASIHKSKAPDGPQLLLFPGLILLIVSPFVSLSRGGAIITAGGLLAIGLTLLFQGSISTKAKIGFLSLFIILGAAAWMLALNSLVRRFEVQKDQDFLSGRTEIYKNAYPITRDYPVYGTGPGTFRSVYQLYRTEVTQLWHAFVHNDWLETRITFGWVGYSLVLLQLALLFLWCFSPGRAPVPPVFGGCLLISLIGTLIHARFDFPFQTYSIFFTFVLISAISVSGSMIKRAS